MKKDAQKYVEECSVCQQNKLLAMTPTWLLLPLATLDTMWEGTSMDFIEGLLK